MYRPTRVLRSFLLSNRSSFALFFEYLINSLTRTRTGINLQDRNKPNYLFSTKKESERIGDSETKDGLQ